MMCFAFGLERLYSVAHDAGAEHVSASDSISCFLCVSFFLRKPLVLVGACTELTRQRPALNVFIGWTLYLIDGSGNMDLRHLSQNPIPARVPILLMCRHPFAWSLALHRFWERRTDLLVPASFSDFLRNPLIVYDNTGSLRRPRYRFSGPIDYWNSYYYSWMEWGDIEAVRSVIRCEELVEDPASVLGSVAISEQWQRRERGALELPAQRVGPKVSSARPDELSSLCLADEDFIRQRVDPSVATALGYRFQ